MEQKFEIVFLEEAFEFLSGLERKHSEKYFIISEKLKLRMTPNYSRNLTRIFGSLGLCIKDYNTDYLLFGIKTLQKIH